MLKMATTTKSQTGSHPTSANSFQTGRAKEDIQTLKNKVTEVNKKKFF